MLPGWIDAELIQGTRRHVAELHHLMLAGTRRAAGGADLAGIALFLAAPASDFLTGAAISVEGSYSSMGV